MQISRDTLLACPPEEAADLLYEQGKALRGRNLKKSSWLLIANGLHVQRISAILLQRLVAATTREDALRVLRIARKHVRERKKGTGGAKRQGPQENPQAVAIETSPEKYRDDEEEIRWELEMFEEIWPQGNFPEWLTEQENLDPTGRARLPGLRPLSRLQEAIHRYAWEHRQTAHDKREDIRSRLDEETYRQLMALAGDAPRIELTSAEAAFLREHGLDRLLQYAESARPVTTFETIRDGISLVGLRILEDHAKARIGSFPIDWEAIAAWLNRQVTTAPQPDTTEIVIASAYAFFCDAPAPLLADFLRPCAGWHAAWGSLLGYAFQRTAEILPDRAVTRSEVPGWWGPSGAYVNDIRWERALDAGGGSRLVLHSLRKNVEDLFRQPNLVKNHHWNGVRKLLMAGGGSLRRMDYPSFTLVCRPSISLVRLETFTQLVRLATELLDLRVSIIYLSRDSLVKWIEETFQTLSPNALPAGWPQLIAETLERHAIAYLMLKERVLRDTFQAAPFRLRRKHIQRFWADQESVAQRATAHGAEPHGNANQPTLPFPQDFPSLRVEFGDDAVHEALAHALLDHFKDDWGVPESDANPLKETLLTLVRGVAISYRLRDLWLPPDGRRPEEDDLEHTQEVANFLIQQTENAPLELAQALLIDPQQGLPRLAGGRLTHLEQECRRLVKAIAGVSQQKISGGEARIFTCQPIPKSASLDRGNLGGDCSSGSVPMRALSPHHVYYGIFENGEQQRGYITVYEAWAATLNEEGDANSERFPVLCLETINVPMRVFDAVQQDLLVILEAVAKSRGLAEGLVLITSLGTWNFQNGEILRQSRRARQGKPVRLFPADPAGWNVYQLLALEAEHYTTFFDDATARRYRHALRLLAPFQSELDTIEPENLAEAQRIAALPPKRLRPTAQGKDGTAGFISDLPEIL